MDLDLVGQQSGALVAFVPPMSIKDRSLHGLWSSHRFFLSRAYTCLWGREGLFLSCHGFWLFPNRLFRMVIYIGLRRSKHHTERGLQCWGLRVRAWTGTWTLWQEWNGLVLLVLGVRARRVFLGHPAGHIDLRITISAWWYDLTMLWHHSKN
jgi:hypothetical protein